MSSTDVDANDSTDLTGESEVSRLIDEMSIAHHGRHYYFDGYRYERLEDAVAYARIVRARQGPRLHSVQTGPMGAVESPSADDRELMLDLAIRFEGGSFIFEGFRYDRLIDAANYARHRRQLGSSAHAE